MILFSKCLRMVRSGARLDRVIKKGTRPSNVVSDRGEQKVLKRLGPVEHKSV